MRTSSLGAPLFVLAALASQAQEVLSLTASSSLERKIAAGELQRLALTAEAGQFLQITVEQRGIDLVAGLTDPAGQRLAEVNNPGGAAVPEAISLVAEVSGTYVLDLFSA